MLLTVKDVEEALQLGRTRTYELVRSGELPVIRIGRAVRIPRDALRDWIQDQCFKAPG
jgi:excisionase family DNA binding protein